MSKSNLVVKLELDASEFHAELDKVTERIEKLSKAGPEETWRKVIASAVRRNCTLSPEAYKAGGDELIYAVADWIENPPEWVKFR